MATSISLAQSADCGPHARLACLSPCRSQISLNVPDRQKLGAPLSSSFMRGPDCCPSWERGSLDLLDLEEKLWLSSTSHLLCSSRSCGGSSVWSECPGYPSPAPRAWEGGAEGTSTLSRHVCPGVSWWAGVPWWTGVPGGNVCPGGQVCLVGRSDGSRASEGVSDVRGSDLSQPGHLASVPWRLSCALLRIVRL